MTNEPQKNAPAILASGLVLAAILFLLAAVYSSITIIQPGNVGVVFNRWSGALKTVGQGLAWQAGRKRHVRQLRGHQVAGIPVRSHRLRNLGQDVGRVEELASVVLRCGGALSSRPRPHGGRRT